MMEDAKAALAEEEGAAVDCDLRRFLILVIGKLILGTRGDPVSCRCLPILEDLSSVGNYAWGAALLAHLFDSLGTSSRVTGVAGFFPLLQVWAYHHLPSLGRGELRPAGAVPLLRCWRFRRDEQSLRRQVTMIHDALDSMPFGHWTPYVGEDDAAQPWVERGRPYFGRDIWLHSFNTVVPLHHRLVARTLGLHQSFDPEGQIASLEGILHLTIQQRDDLQAVLEQLREELDRAQQMVVGASSSREDPGRSLVVRAEDALAQAQEREAELRDSLARTTVLETEMAELPLRPEAAEVTRWHQEAEEATRLRAEAGDLHS
ncbi:hypothetical protein Taro_045232 [Colocasia esculenta]|uniref:Aminotransferase-like plant mobile domain-containing protein n=1 Tax=Colocasia esculenta TaxID=4460 RepID=A0A843X3W7_COLES|nr:hypothetical protein [Colocasia esculenta]